MKITKEQLFESALALNGDDKKYQITVENDKIITRVKWMDATFFAPDVVTDEMREFEYVVKVDGNSKYSECDKSISKTKSVDSKGFGYNKEVFVGKQITFNKTVGFGKDKNFDKTGVVDITFNSEEYKNPVRALLKDSGYKKKMSTTKKIVIGASIFAAVAIIAAVILILTFCNKKPISASEFESAAKSSGYQVGIDHMFESTYDELDAVRIAIDNEDDYQIEFYVFKDSTYAEGFYANNKADLESLLSSSSSSSSSSGTSPNYTYYSGSSSALYLYIARIDNTVLYINTYSKNEAEIEKFIDKIDY